MNKFIGTKESRWNDKETVNHKSTFSVT